MRTITPKSGKNGHGTYAFQTNVTTVAGGPPEWQNRTTQFELARLSPLFPSGLLDLAWPALAQQFPS